MALTNYGELKTAVAAWLNKSNLTTVIPDFITLAEVDIRRDLRVPAMETLVTGTLSGETLPHPSRFLSARRLTVSDTVYSYHTPAQYEATKLASTEPRIFTSIGTNFYVLGGTAGDSYSLVYTAYFDSLVGDTSTNWVLTNAPGVYLAAACRHGAVYLKDTEAESGWAAKYAGEVARENASGRVLQRPGLLQVRAA